MKPAMEKEETPKKTEKRSAPDVFVVLSAILFAVVCSISAFLFFENMRLASSIEANKTEVAQYSSSIEKIKSDRKVIAAELVSDNKAEIEKSIRMSEVQKYITELQDISKKYKMMFAGFSYENGKITTSAVSVPETVLVGDDGVKKISQMVRDYRTGSGSIFQLSPVLSIAGYAQKRSFSIEFNVAGMSQE